MTLRAVFAFCLLSIAASAEYLGEDQTIYERLKGALAGKPEYIKRSVKRIGEQKIALELLITFQSSLPTVKRVIGDFSGYSRWALNNVNRRPAGGNYLVQFSKVEFKPPEQLLLNYAFSVNMLVASIERSGVAEFKVRSQDRNGIFVVDTETAGTWSSPGIQSVAGTLRVYPGEKVHQTVWVHVGGVAKLKPWLYELLPERVMEHEAGDRIQLFLDNYVREENRQFAEKMAR